jgi:DNA-binding transcriptional MocR family regulator
VRASSRDIASATRCSKRNIVRAIDALSTRGLIAVRQGTATKAAGYLLRFLEITRMGGPTTGPPPPAGDPADVDLFQDQGGPVTGPPPTENAELPPPPR